MENVYSQGKMFHFYGKLDDLKNGRVTPPVHVRMKPINACNHRCFYCCYRNDDLFLGELMDEKHMIPEDKMKSIIADLADCGVGAVTFTGGGEPLIYPHIDMTIESLLNHGIKVAALTNGARLNGETARLLARGASWVRLSIDSVNGPMLAESRKVGLEEFDVIMNNIAAFSKQKTSDCELGINFIITRMNKDHVYDFLRLMKEQGADHVKVCECIVSTDGDENNTYHAPHFNEVLEQIHRAESDLSDGDFKVVNKFHVMDDKFEKTYTQCPFLGYLNVIAADLNVYTCQDKAYTPSGILGSIRTLSLKELWQSEEYKNAVRALNPSVDCHHHCVSHGKNLALNDFLSTDKRHLEFV